MFFFKYASHVIWLVYLLIYIKHPLVFILAKETLVYWLEYGKILIDLVAQYKCHATAQAYTRGRVPFRIELNDFYGLLYYFL